MRIKTFKLLSIAMIFIFVMSLSSIQTIALGYLTTYPRLSDLYYLEIISYKDNNDDNIRSETSENLSILRSTGWSSNTLNDNKIKATKKHYRDEVVIRYRQDGYTDGTGIKVEGSYATSGKTYDTVSGYIPQTGKFGVIAWFEEFTAWHIDPNLPESDCVITARVTDESGTHTYTQTLTIEWADDRADAPKVSFRYDPETGKYFLSNADSTMEYRLQSKTEDDWIRCTDAPVEFNVPSSDVVYYVRYAATEDSDESKTAIITLHGRRDAPSCTYNKSTEMLSGLTDKMEISYGGNAFTPVPSGTTSLSMSEHIDTIPADSTSTVEIRYPSTASNAPSKSKTITLNPRLSPPENIVYDPITVSLSGVSSDMQYKLSGDTSWTSIYGTTLKLLKHASSESDVVVLVRYSSTSDNSGSRAVEFTIPKLLNGPSGTIDYTNEVISGFDNNTAYEYLTSSSPSNDSSSWKEAEIINGSFDISEMISTTNKTVSIRKAATETAPVTAYTTFSIPARPAKPKSAAFVYNDANHYDQAVLTGVSYDAEYKLSSASDWTGVADDNIVFDIPDSNTKYNVRYKATPESFASSDDSITLSKRGTAPTSAYSTTTEIITKLTSAMEISYNSGEYTAIPAEVTSLDMSEIIDKLSANETMTVKIRKSATSDDPASLDKIFILYPRLASPTTVTYDKAAVSLSGVSSAMQYRLETSTSWTDLTSTKLSLLSYASPETDIKVYVRYEATATNSASLPVEFTIPKLADGPNVTVDYLNERIIGFDNNTAYQYYVGTSPSVTSSSWKTAVINGGSFDVSDIITSSEKTIHIRKAATSDEPVSYHTTLTLPKRKTAPSDVSFVYNDSNYYEQAVLTGVSSDMEYRLSTVSEWTSITEDKIVFDIPASNATYYVRYKASPEGFASTNKSITLSKRGTAPSCSYSTTTEILTGISSAMEISYNGSEYTVVEAGITSLDMSEAVNGLTKALTINIRRSATSAAPASSEKSIVIYPRLAAPAAVSYNKASISLSGVSSSMQYRLETSTSWTAISGSTLNLISYASTENDVKVLVRYKPTTANSASLPVEFIIPKLLDGPNCYIDYSNERIAGLDNNTAYQYYVGTSPSVTSTSWKTAAITDGGFDVSDIVSTSAKTLNIRKAATANEPITNYITLTLPARSSAPTTPAFVYNSENYYDKAVLTGVSSDMEYKLSTASEWISITGSEVVFDIPEKSNEKYYVRYKANSENFASKNMTITLYKRSSIPSSIYDEQSYQIIPDISTDTKMEAEDEDYILPDADETTPPDPSNTVSPDGSDISVSDLTDGSSSDLLDTALPDNDISQ